MKRSELYKVILDNLPGTYDYTYEQEEGANQLLEAIEEAFRKNPPNTKKCPVLLREEFVWEPEQSVEKR